VIFLANKKKYTIIVMPQSIGRIRKFSISRSSLILVLSFFVLITITVICSLVWGTRINHQNSNLWNEYQSLHSEYYKQKEELEKIAAEIEKARKREQIIRDVLGIEGGSNSSGFGLGQGGTAYDLTYPNPPNPSVQNKSQTKLSNNSNKYQGVQSFVRRLSSSDTDNTDNSNNLQGLPTSRKVDLLNANLEQLLSQIEAKRTGLSHTPSIRPVMTSDYWYSSGFGPRPHPITRVWQFHPALDISAKLGTPIVAAADGKIVSMSYDQLLGLTIKIQHSSVCSTVYGHLLAFENSLRAGSQVHRNQVIGYVGVSGRTTGPHLHYEVWVNNKPQNPAKFILN
jgi:murein DD-endopeptidase MepM/ murein hydrolase activator NlpD